MKNNRGFTLVELIVVIAIIGIIACMLIPNIMKYVRRAKITAAIVETKNIVTAAKNGLIEQSVSGNVFYIDKNATISGTNTKVGGLSNTAMNKALGGNTGTNLVDTAIAKLILESISDNAVNPGNARSGNDIFGQNCQNYIDSIGADFGVIVVYTADGSVPFVQYYRNGILVTYAYGEYVANDSGSAKFISKNQSWKQAFLDAGENINDIPANVINSQIKSW